MLPLFMCMPLSLSHILFNSFYHVYIYIQREGEREIVDWENLTRYKKINSKMDKPNTDNKFTLLFRLYF